MFKCTKCGNTPAGTTEFKVIIAIRKVEYNVQIKYHKIFQENNMDKIQSNCKTVKKTFGTEIVKENSYCKKCLPENFKPQIIETVKRNQIVATKKLHMRDKEAEGDIDGKKEKRNKTKR